MMQEMEMDKEEELARLIDSSEVRKQSERLRCAVTRVNHSVDLLIDRLAPISTEDDHSFAVAPDAALCYYAAWLHNITDALEFMEHKVNVAMDCLQI